MVRSLRPASCWVMGVEVAADYEIWRSVRRSRCGLKCRGRFRDWGSGEVKQKMDKFSYLGVMISRDGGFGYEVAHRMLEERKVWGTMAKLWKENMMSS